MFKFSFIAMAFMLIAGKSYASANTTADSVCPGNTSLYCHLNPSDLQNGEHNIVYSCMSANQVGNSNNVHYPVTNAICPIQIPPDDCGEDPQGEPCEVGTAHSAGHTLNIHMGGFQDGLYVCKVEVTGHLCDLDDANVDADVLTDAQGNLLGDGKSYTFPKPAMTSNGTTDNQSSELHLNSFRFGSMYRVTYCYDYRRATSRRVTNQEGLLTGSMAANTALDDYAAIAGVSATLDWSCSDTLGTVAAAAAPVTYNALDNSANNTLDVLAIFPDLGISQTGSCVFTVDFVEDGNVGAIRPVHATNVDGITHGTIDTDVNLSMDLIQN